MSSLRKRPRQRLVKRLQAAHRSLCVWCESVREMAEPAIESGAEMPAHVRVTLALLRDAKQSINRRLVELGAAGGSGNFSKLPKRSRKAIRSSDSDVSSAARTAVKLYRLCVNACRACGNVLGIAFQEARAAADVASAGVLYAALRALEKLMWVLDPRQPA